MQHPNISIPGYRLNEYLLVLNPHQDLSERIMKVKEQFSKDYQTTIAKSTKPHITLINFINWSMMEERILHRLQLIAMGVTPFKVELRDFGSFPTHTIFINVVSKLPIQGLVKELKVAQQLLKLNNDNKPHFIDEPHLTICRKLKPWQYEKGWHEYSHRHFTGRFIADSMLLIRRPSGQPGAFQIAKRFAFQNFLATTKQGNLFM